MTRDRLPSGPTAATTRRSTDPGDDLPRPRPRAGGLIGAFLSHAVAEAGGYARFRDDATTTITLVESGEYEADHAGVVFA